MTPSVQFPALTGSSLPAALFSQALNGLPPSGFRAGDAFPGALPRADTLSPLRQASAPALDWGVPEPKLDLDGSPGALPVAERGARATGDRRAAATATTGAAPTAAPPAGDKPDFSTPEGVSKLLARFVGGGAGGTQVVPNLPGTGGGQPIQLPGGTGAGEGAALVDRLVQAGKIKGSPELIGMLKASLAASPEMMQDFAAYARTGRTLVLSDEALGKANNGQQMIGLAESGPGGIDKITVTDKSFATLNHEFLHIAGGAGVVNAPEHGPEFQARLALYDRPLGQKAVDMAIAGAREEQLHGVKPA